MRRRWTMVLGLALPLVAYSHAYAQPKGAPASSTSASAGSARESPSAASAAPPAVTASASPVGATAQPSAAGQVSPLPPTAAGASDGAGKPDAGMSGATYAVKLRDLSQRVDELKDQIRRSHTRLALLSDTILAGGAAGSRAEVQFKDEMTSAFLLTHALFVIDNQVQYNKHDDSGALADQKEIPIYTGSVPPGDHTIQVALTFQGNGYGVFSYLRGYKFDVKSSHSFTAVEGKALDVVATAYEKGGVTTPLEQRPTIEWHETLKPLVGGVGASAGAPSVPASETVSAGVKK